MASARCRGRGWCRTPPRDWAVSENGAGQARNRQLESEHAARRDRTGHRKSIWGIDVLVSRRYRPPGRAAVPPWHLIGYRPGATGRHPAGSLSKVTELDCLVLARPFVAHSRECDQSEIPTDGIRVCVQAIVGINVARIKYAAQIRFYLNAGRKWYIPPDGPDFEEIKSWLCAVRF